MRCKPFGQLQPGQGFRFRAEDVRYRDDIETDVTYYVVTPKVEGGHNEARSSLARPRVSVPAWLEVQLVCRNRGG